MEQTVITEEQARKITGGRKPLVPVEYEEACAALTKCIDLDEAKYWSDKADALAAWAKIYRDDKITNDAKRLKLKAYRRMGELASDVAAAKRKSDGGAGSGINPTALGVLRKQGLTEAKAQAASKLARTDRATFDKLVSLKKPPTPTVAAMRNLAGGSGAWKLISHGDPRGLANFRGFCRAHGAAELGKQLTPSEAKLARDMVLEVQEWLDAFEQAISRA